MKQIGDIINSIDMNDPRDKFNYKEPFNGAEQDRKTELVIDEIFNKLEVLFSGFKYTWPTDEKIEIAKHQWFLAFKDANIREIERVNIGLAKLRQLDSNFPPSPGQFIKLCEPSFEELGWPSIEDAYKEAALLVHPQSSKKWTHSGIRETVRTIGSFDFAHMNEKESRKKFEEVYKKLMAECVGGKELPKLTQDQGKDSFRPQTEAEKNWIAYRKGAPNVPPPPGGWFSMEAQDRMWREKDEW